MGVGGNIKVLKVICMLLSLTLTGSVATKTWQLATGKNTFCMQVVDV